MLIKFPPQSKIKLLSILKKKKKTLSSWLSESGIQTYDQMTAQCTLMGVSSPTHEEYTDVRQPAQHMNSLPNITVQTEGIIAIDIEPKIIKEQTGIEEVESIKNFDDITDGLRLIEDQEIVKSKKKYGRKNDSTSSD